MLRVAVPNKGTLSEPAAAMLREAGYRQRTEARDLTVLDTANDVEFFFLRPKDIAVYVGSGELDLGITGRDLAQESGAEVHELVELGFGHSSFRYAGPAEREWHVADLAGKRIASAYPNLVRADLAAHGIEPAEVTRLDGAVEISIQLGLADAIADVVGSGRTLRQHGLVAFGDVICASQAVLITRNGAAPGETPQIAQPVRQLANRLRGVVLAQQYVMLDYDCPRSLLERATAITPGLESPTVAPLAEPDWVAVRAMVPRAEANPVMDALAELGAKAVLASDIRSCRL
ncbi:ATP phosphoribosyltransferase [Nakamurella leprariae]|uniref:ATP phosphoribosyltransferase n=1 Tax=Nakamurella leprariae TaxID=2803911 RepID=A0A939C156_9ACTN|nr:ATP phosphoribosyltransferase [Nakamurella leprariae]MBM9466779.1 ATP phosphoribosyltransferase [Nakamurella leprariae]